MGETEHKSEERLILEAYRLAEQQLQSQVEVALAADQRAVSFCGLVIAAVAASVGLSPEGDLERLSNVIALAFFAASAAASAFALRPTSFNVRGIPFVNFREDIDANRDYISVVKEIARICDELSEENRKCIKRNAKSFRVSVFLAIAGLFSLVYPFVLQPLTAPLLACFGQK